MSFEKELFNSYDIVYNRYSGRLKELKDYIDMLSSKYNMEVDYSNEAKKISDANINLISDNSVSEGINSLKNFFFNHNSYIDEFISAIREEVLDPIKETFKELKNRGTKLNEEFRRSEKLLNEILEKLEKSKNKYYVNSKLEDEQKIKLEELKFLNLTDEQKNKIISKAEGIKSEAKESEVSYIYQVDYTNNVREKHLHLLRNTLSEFQKIEEIYINSVKDSLRKFNIYQIAFVRNMQYDLEKQGKINEAINSKKDITNFIDKYAQDCNLPKKIEFIPYSPDIQVENPSKVSYSLFGSVKDFLSNKINYIRKNTDEDQTDERIIKEIQSSIQFIWEGNILPIERKLIILKFLKEKKYRRSFFDNLNKYRINGQFILGENTYAVLGDMLLNILDEIVKAKDYESFRYCLILSQTFYKISKENNKPRIFLQNAIEIHSVCTETHFWEEVIKFSIEDEFNKQNSLSIYPYDNSNEVKKRHQNLVFGQLISFSFNILSFDVKKSKMKEILLKFADKYELSEELKESLISNVETYNTKTEADIDSYSTLDKKRVLTDEERDKAELHFIKRIINESLSQKTNESTLIKD